MPCHLLTDCVKPWGVKRKTAFSLSVTLSRLRREKSDARLRQWLRSRPMALGAGAETAAAVLRSDPVFFAHGSLVARSVHSRKLFRHRRQTRRRNPAFTPAHQSHW